MNFLGEGKKDEKQLQNTQTLPVGMTPEQVQQQQALAKLSKELDGIKEKIDIQYLKIEKLEAKIQGLKLEGKTTEADSEATNLKILEDELMESENLATTLEKEKVQLEATLETRFMIEALKMANSVQKLI
jgi:hypothetical protein